MPPVESSTNREYFQVSDRFEMFLEQSENGESQDACCSSESKSLFNAQAVPGLEGEHHLERIGHFSRHILDLGKPVTQIPAQNSCRSFMFFLKKGRPPSLKSRRANIGRQFSENLDAALDQSVDSLEKRARLGFVDEER